MYLFSRQFLEDLQARLSGPMHVRFLMQPIIGCLLGVHDGLMDAKSGKKPFIYCVCFDRIHRKEEIKGALRSLIRPVLIGIVLDAAVQIIMFGRIWPGAAFVIGSLLFVIPYAVARALTNRIMTFRKGRKKARG